MLKTLGQWEARQLLLYGIEWEKSLPQEVWILQFCRNRRVFSTYEEADVYWKYLEHNGRCDFGLMEKFCRGEHSLSLGHDEIPLASFMRRLRWDRLADKEAYALCTEEKQAKKDVFLATLPPFDPKPSPAPIPGVVYVLMAEDRFPFLVKIGRSISLTVRLETLQTACPYKLCAIREIQTDDTSAIESALHRRYAKWRKCGEWFELPIEAYEEVLYREFIVKEPL
jgi:Meiotically up-regulated gene 113